MGSGGIPGMRPDRDGQRRFFRIRVQNARTAAAARRPPHDGRAIRFLCECDDESCGEHVSLTLRAYDGFRDDYLYLTAPGHAIASGRLVRVGRTFDVHAA